MKAAYCKNFKQVEIKEISCPSAKKGEIILKVQVCGLCGSDIKKLEGSGLSSPQVLGHELAGVVHEVGEGVKKFSVGDRVVSAHHVPCFDCHYCQHENYSMCRTFKTSHLDPGGFAQYLRVPAPHVQHASFKIPDEISNEIALFTEPLACCLRCLKRVTLKPNDHITLVGFGSIGLLFLALLKRISLDIAVLDLDDARLEKAAMMGAKPMNPKRDCVKTRIQEMTHHRGSDVILFTAGSPETVNDALSWVRDGGTLVFFSELSQEKGPLNFKEIYKREITLTSSYSPGPEDLQEAFELISQKQVDLNEIPMDSFPLEEIPKAVEMTLARKIFKAAIYPWKQ